MTEPLDPHGTPTESFPTTRWSLILGAGVHDDPAAREALATLTFLVCGGEEAMALGRDPSPEERSGQGVARGVILSFALHLLRELARRLAEARAGA